MNASSWETLAVFAQQGDNIGYRIGQVLGTIFAIVLGGALLWRVVQKK